MMGFLNRYPRLFSTLFILSLPLSYFSIWVGAFIKIGNLLAAASLFLFLRLLTYAVVMTLGMIGFRHLFFKTSVSILKVIIAAICTPFVIFMCMAILDAIVFSIIDGASVAGYFPDRVSIYLSRFYMIGVIAVMITGLLYKLSDEARRRDETSGLFG